ncbi:hypothetical protein CC662_25915 [Salmonella enterica subsp. enterica]|nr:hypothetical protein [Salmonella enterica subsp. enterica]
MNTISAESGSWMFVTDISLFILPCQYWPLVFHNLMLLALDEEYSGGYDAANIHGSSYMVI